MPTCVVVVVVRAPVVGGGAAVVTVVWRVVVVVASGSPAHEINIRATTDNAALSIIPFFIVNGLFTTNSSQVPSADVLGHQILYFRRE